MAEMVSIPKTEMSKSLLSSAGANLDFSDIAAKEETRRQKFETKVDETEKSISEDIEKSHKATFDFVEAANKAQDAFKQPPPEQKETSPAEAFGSVASVFATFASLLTRQPFTNALNASAQAMNAFKENNKAEHERAMEAYKINIENAKTMYSLQSDAYNAIIRDTDMSVREKQAALTAYATAFKDETMLTLGTFKDQISMTQFLDNYNQKLRDYDLRFQNSLETQWRDRENAGLRQQLADLTRARDDARNDKDRAALDAKVKAAEDRLAIADKGVPYEDPEQTDEQGNPIGYLFHPVSGKAETYDQQPFKPSPAARPAGKSSTNPTARAFADFKAANPNATPEQEATFLQTMRAQGNKPPTLAQMQAQAAQQKIDELKKSLGREPSADEKTAAIREARTGKVPDTQQERDTAAGLGATGMPFNQIIYGYGEDARTSRKLLLDDTVDLIQSRNPGMTREDAVAELGERQIEFQAGKRSVEQLEIMFGSLQPALDQLDYNVKQTIEELKKVGNTDISPVLNKIRQRVEYVKGNEDLNTLWYFMNGVATESARIQMGATASRAQLQAGAAEEASKWANSDITPKGFANLGKAIIGEATNRNDNYLKAIKSQKTRAVSGTEKAPASDKKPLIIKTQEEFDKLKKGDHFYEPGDPTEYMK